MNRKKGEKNQEKRKKEQKLRKVLEAINVCKHGNSEFFLFRYISSLTVTQY